MGQEPLFLMGIKQDLDNPRKAPVACAKTSILLSSNKFLVKNELSDPFLSVPPPLRCRWGECNLMHFSVTI